MMMSSNASYQKGQSIPPLSDSATRDQGGEKHCACGLLLSLGAVLTTIGFLLYHPNPYQASAQLVQSVSVGTQSFLMYAVVPHGDFGPFREYSVIHSDRSLNLMSAPFQEVMRDLSQLLKTTYNADKVAIIPGSGTFGMEAVARQFATDKHVMVLRNGLFSYRWSEIFDWGRPAHGIPTTHTVLKAEPVRQQENVKENHPIQYQPHPLDQVREAIARERPAVLFAPHVETSTGMILPDDYMRSLSEAMHAVDGLLVLDCVASGTVWIDMKAQLVDVVITAPQKVWTAPPCAALVMLSNRAVQAMASDTAPQETSFSMSLPQWLSVMDAYENGGFAYHTTPPTDCLLDFQQVSVEMLQFGLPALKQAQRDLGARARAILDAQDLTSVAAPGFQAPGVLVYYSPHHVDNAWMVSLFQQQHLQIAQGVPWKIGEPADTRSFRVGLFGVDKLEHPQRTLSILEAALQEVLSETE